MGAMNYTELAQELLTALRGKRSQIAWSRRLGYRSNVAYSWESGRRFPTAAETFRAARRAGVDLEDALTRFYGRTPPWLEGRDPATPEVVAALMDDLRGATPIVELAQRADLSRFSMSRWLSAETEPRLPDFLRFVEAASVRMVDLVASLVDPAALPSVAGLWARMEARRRGAYELPWTQALLRALELDSYQALPEHQPGWLSTRLGLPLDEEERGLAFLAETGQISWTGARWRVEPIAVDTRRSPEVGRRLKAHWSRVAAERVARGAPGQFSYNVFTVSRADFERLRTLHLAYFHELRQVVASSQPGECVAVANVQLFALEATEAVDHEPEPAPTAQVQPAPARSRRGR